MPIKFKYPDPAYVLAPSTLRMCSAQGFLVVKADVPFTIDGRAGTGHYAEFARMVEIEFEPGATAIEIRTDTISSLNKAELVGAVAWLGVSTTATTKSGIKKAVERHLEES
jgi:hypothetical protein